MFQEPTERDLLLSNKATENEGDESINEDDLVLSSMGYKQELKRSLGSFVNFTFGFSTVSVLTCMSITYGFGLKTGGPVTLIWSWIVAFIFTMLTALSMAEICSAYPTAGSVYHWAGMIVPIKYNPIVSYATGWLNFLGNAGGDASTAYAFVNFFCASVFASGGYDLNNTFRVFFSIGILLIWTIMNCYAVDSLGWFTSFAAVLQVGSLIFIAIGLLSSASELNTTVVILTEYSNTTGWSSTSYVVCIGILSALYSFAGYEASAHMAEETIGSRTAAPNGIIYTCLATGIVGLVYLLSLLYVTTDISYALDGLTDNAAVNVFISTAGTDLGTFMAWVVTINIFFAGMSGVTISGRISYALLRDGAFPHSDFWSQVDHFSKSPIRALFFVFINDAVLLLFPLFSEVAFESIVGISIIGFLGSYGIPILLKLIYKWDCFPQTEMSLGSYSNIIGIISCFWLFGSCFILILPLTSPVTIQSFNWTVVVVGGFIAIGSLYWLLYGSKNFRGPSRKADDL